MEQRYDELIKTGRGDDYTSPYTDVATAPKVIPHFLLQESKVTIDHKGAIHKGYIQSSLELEFQFAVR